MTDWQKIETAPKDGTRVLLFIPYKAAETQCTDEGHWDAAQGCWRFDGDDGPFDIQPTHWKPLP